MEHIREVVKRKGDSLTLRSPEPSAISQRAPESLDEAIQLIEDSGAPKWFRPMMQLAQDRRQQAEAGRNQNYWDEYEVNFWRIEAFKQAHGRTPMQDWCQKNKAEVAR